MPAPTFSDEAAALARNESRPSGLPACSLASLTRGLRMFTKAIAKEIAR